VGTSLIIIIPEGVETLYSARATDVGHARRNALPGQSPVLWHRSRPPLFGRTEGSEFDPFHVPGPAIVDELDAPPKTPTEPGVVGIMEDSTTHPEAAGDEGRNHHHDESNHAWMGIALISGFILMYFIDKVPHYLASSKPKTNSYHISLSNLGRPFNSNGPNDEDAEGLFESRDEGRAPGRGFATTTGLVIHAAADGIALGASSTTSNSGLSLIIFFAIMVHKAPAAFGLTSVLLKQGLSKRSARSHLLLFSLAAPAGALVTWTLAHVLGSGSITNTESTKWWTGMLLLLSAGTFLYVAMHTMQENSPDHEPYVNGHANGSIDEREIPKQDRNASLTDLFAAAFGMILPLFLQVGHAH